MSSPANLEPSLLEVTTPVPDFDIEASWADESRHAVPEAPPEGAKPLAREVYGTAGADGRDLELLVYARADAAERRPAIVLVHGGGWMNGAPEHYARHAYRLAGEGFVTACISYRLIGEARWPACLEDVKCSIRWMRAHAAELGADPGRIAVMGGSAGAHLAAIAALASGRFEGSGGQADVSSVPQAVVLSCPPLGVGGVEALFGDELAAKFYDLFFGATRDEKTLESASVLKYISAGAPPFVVHYGDADPITPPDAMRVFAEALAAAGVPSELVRWRGRNHGFEAAPADFEDLITRVVEFLHRRLEA